MKKNNLLILVAIMLITTLGLTSCGDNIAKHIPEDAFAVAVIDGKELIEYSKDVDIFENEEMQMLKDEYSNEMKNTIQLLMDAIEDPDNTGILWSKKSYFFATFFGEDIVAGYLIPISKSVLEENMELVGKDFGFPVSMMFKSKNDIKYFEPEETAILAYTDNLLFFLINESTENSLDIIESMLNQEKGNSILNNKDFSTFHKNCKDINLWVSSDLIENNFDNFDEIDEFEKLTGIELAGNYGHFHFSFSKKEIIFTQKLRFNESIQNLETKKLFENADKIVELFTAPVTKGFDYFYHKDGDYEYEEFDEWEEIDWMDMTDEELEKELEALLEEMEG